MCHKPFSTLSNGSIFATKQIGQALFPHSEEVNVILREIEQPQSRRDVQTLVPLYEEKVHRYIPLTSLGKGEDGSIRVYRTTSFGNSTQLSSQCSVSHIVANKFTQRSQRRYP